MNDYETEKTVLLAAYVALGLSAINLGLVLVLCLIFVRLK